MPRNERSPRLAFRRCAPLSAVLLTAFASTLPHALWAQTPPATPPVFGPTIEGRAAAPVPVGANTQQVAPEGGSGVVYEKARIKRSVSLEPSSGLDGNWDVLYTAGTGDGQRTAYLNWDNDFVYLAMETASPQSVRFDIDGKDDGWLRGADNLTVFVNVANNKPQVTTYRFDTVQNRDQPVWAASPIPASALTVKVGQTPRGTSAVILALPRTEDIGFIRKAGQSFGIRIDAGALPDPTSETATLAVRPMLRVFLADNIEARTPKGLVARLKIGSPEHVLGGDQIKATLEVKNEGSAPIRVNRLSLRGSLSSFPLLDSANLTGEDIAPGKTIKRELKSGVAPSAPFATLVLTGTVESDEGAIASPLASVAHVEPYEMRLELDKRPAGGGADAPGGFYRTAKVVIRSRIKARDAVKATLTIPDKWRIELVEPKNPVRMDYQGDVKGLFYKIFIPIATPLGNYPIEATIDVGGRTYRAKGTISMVQQ